MGKSRSCPVCHTGFDKAKLFIEQNIDSAKLSGFSFSKICPQVIEVGPPNATIHKIDEHLHVADIEPLKNIYRRVLENLNTRPMP